MGLHLLQSMDANLWRHGSVESPQGMGKGLGGYRKRSKASLSARGNDCTTQQLGTT